MQKIVVFKMWITQYLTVASVYLRYFFKKLAYHFEKKTCTYINFNTRLQHYLYPVISKLNVFL